MISLILQSKIVLRKLQEIKVGEVDANHFQIAICSFLSPALPVSSSKGSSQTFEVFNFEC